MNGIETTLLRLGGVPQDTIDEVEKALPSVAALLTLYKQNQDLITKLLSVAQEAQPLLAKATPLLNQALLEVNKVLPAAQDIVSYLQDRGQSTTVDIADRQGSGPT